MSTSVYNIRLDDELKAKAFSVFEGYGITPDQAIRLFLKQTAETKKVPISFDYQASDSTMQAPAELENAGGTVYKDLEKMLADNSEQTEITETDIDLSQYSEKQRKLYEIMTETAKRGTAFQGVDGVAYQNEIRQDKVLAFREKINCHI